MGNSFLGLASPLTAFEAAINKSSTNLEISHLIPTTNQWTGILSARLHSTHKCTATWQYRIFTIFHSKRVSLPQSLESGFGLGSFWYTNNIYT